VVFVTSASVQYRDGLPMLLREGKALCPRLTNVLVDGVYTGQVVKQARQQTGVGVEVRKRPEEQKGFHVIPTRWLVERSLGWMNRDRRLSKDDERTIASSESWVKISFIGQMTRRLA